jgi:hypothetical protein
MNKPTLILILSLSMNSWANSNTLDCTPGYGDFKEIKAIQIVDEREVKINGATVGQCEGLSSTIECVIEVEGFWARNYSITIFRGWPSTTGQISQGSRGPHSLYCHYKNAVLPSPFRD